MYFKPQISEVFMEIISKQDTNYSCGGSQSFSGSNGVGKLNIVSCLTVYFASPRQGHDLIAGHFSNKVTYQTFYMAGSEEIPLKD